jgi:hypothetical protein
MENIAATRHAKLNDLDVVAQAVTEVTFQESVSIPAEVTSPIGIQSEVKEDIMELSIISPELPPLGDHELLLKQSIIFDVANGISPEGKRKRDEEIFDAIGSEHFHDATLQGIKGWGESLGIPTSKEKR